MSREAVIIVSMNKLKRYARTFAVLVLVGMLVFGGSTALGKSRSDKVSSEPPTIEASRPWMAVVYSVVALAGVCVVAFKNPNRTDSD
jgi:hypothetical protein